MGVYPNSVLHVNLGVIVRFYLISDAHFPLMRQVTGAICRQCGGFSGTGTISALAESALSDMARI